ncbi:MAG: DUF1580 domain-containing protein [Phycisphaerales bacterium]
MRLDNLITLGAAAKRAPGRPSAATIYRWCRQGLKARNGKKIYLKTIRAGGKLFTSEQWLIIFFEAVSNADAAHFEQHKVADHAISRAHRRSDKLTTTDEEYLIRSGA